MAYVQNNLEQTLTASSKRPLPLRVRPDLVVEEVRYRGVPFQVVKDPIRLSYHRLQPEQFTALNLLNGMRSLEDVRTSLAKEYPGLNPTLSDVQKLIEELHEKNLLLSDRPGQGLELYRRDERKRLKGRWQTLRSFLYVRLPGWDPDRLLVRMLPYCRWMFRPQVMAAAAVFVLSAWLLILVQFDSFSKALPEFEQFFGWPNLIWLWLTLVVCKVIHEFGHGLACKYYGGECHEMGVMLLIFSPCLYADVTDSWLFKNKWQRIVVSAAGMYVEIVLSALAIFLWWNTQPGLFHHLCLNVFFVTSLTTVVFNANPLLRYDGYYMLSDFLELPNLRQQAESQTRNVVVKNASGLELPPPPFLPETGQRLLVTFAVLAWLYRFLVVWGVCLFLYASLKPYGFHDLALAMGIFSTAGITIFPLCRLFKIIRSVKDQPVNPNRLAMTVVLLIGLVAAFLWLPIPWHVDSPFHIEPDGVRHVYVTTPGFVIDVKVEPDQKVKAGDVLAVLENPELTDRIQRLERQIGVETNHLRAMRGIGDVAEVEGSEERLESLNKEREELLRQAEDLVIKAPSDGTVIAPERLNEKPKSTTVESLARWQGTPLEAKNRKTWLPTQTRLLSIAPSEKMQAILIVDQGDRESLRRGQQVEIRLDHLPDRVFSSRITQISPRSLEFAPEPLSVKYGGPLASVTDNQGRERLTSAAYQATATLGEAADLLKTGAKGQARVVVEERSAASWCWKWLRQTFHFRL